MRSLRYHIGYFIKSYTMKLHKIFTFLVCVINVGQPQKYWQIWIKENKGMARKNDIVQYKCIFMRIRSETHSKCNRSLSCFCILFMISVSVTSVEGGISIFLTLNADSLPQLCFCISRLFTIFTETALSWKLFS